MRPAGEIRAVVLATAWQLTQERAAGGQAGAAVTYMCVAPRLQAQGVGLRAARWTWDNLVRAGHLQPVASVTLPGARRPLKACVPARPPSGGWIGVDRSTPWVR